METFEHTRSARGRAVFWGGGVLGLLLIAILLTHGFGLFAPRSGEVEAPALVHQGERIIVPEGSALRARLTVMPASTEEVGARLELPGVVESDPARTAAVLAPLAGRIRSLQVALGERVHAGQVLAVIDSPDLGQAHEDNDKAADTFALAQKNLKRQEGQFAIGAASSRDLDQARSDFVQAQAEYTRTQARMKMLGVADPTDDKRSSLLTVVAPMAGSITALAVSPGNMVNDPTQPLMTIADLSTVWVTALVPEKEAGTVSKDEDVEVRLVAYPQRVLHGKVLFVSDVLESDSRRDKVRIAFDNKDYALRPNMFATVTLEQRARARIVVPTSALLMNNDRTSVFVAVAPWTFERRFVQPELEERQTVVIPSGVAPGDQVVVRGGILLND